MSTVCVSIHGTSHSTQIAQGIRSLRLPRVNMDTHIAMFRKFLCLSVIESHYDIYFAYHRPLPGGKYANPIS